MKRFLSALLAIILLLSSMSMLVFAEGEQEEGGELENIAPKGLGYCTSMKNSNWTPPNSINDGVYDWHGWEPKYPSIFPGQDTSAGFSGEYCGIKFINREYYEIHEIKITLGLHAQYRQNATYKIQALVEGEWQDVVTLKDEQFIPDNAEKYSSYEDAMNKDTSNYHISAHYTYTLPTPITTNNLRINVSDFGKNFPGGDVLIFPYIYEVELYGKRGETPDIDLPEGAEFSQNAAYNSLPYASSSTRLYYPFQSIDGNGATGWRPSSLEAGQYLALELAKEYTVDKLAINFGVLPAGKTSVDYAFKLQALVNGQWTDISDSTKAVSHTEEETSYYISEYTLDTSVKTSQVRIFFENALTSAPTIYEFEANIVGDRSYYLSTRFSSLEKLSSAVGNLAILGEAYASANIAPYSDPSFINDGLKFANSNVWFSGLIDIPVSCGVKLDKTYTVNKVVVYCEQPAVIGDDVTRFNILAKIDGEYKVVASGSSYNPTKIVEDSETRYTTIYEFPEGIVTDDIKIEFTRGDSTIPNVKELEIYSNSAIASAFDGYPITSKAKVPVYTDVVIENDDSSNNDTTNDSDEESKGAIVAGVVVCFIAVAIVAFSLVTLNFKKNNAPKVSIEELEAEAEASEGEEEQEPEHEDSQDQE